MRRESFQATNTRRGKENVQHCGRKGEHLSEAGRTEKGLRKANQRLRRSGRG